MFTRFASNVVEYIQDIDMSQIDWIVVTDICLLFLITLSIIYRNRLITKNNILKAEYNTLKESRNLILDLANKHRILHDDLNTTNIPPMPLLDIAAGSNHTIVLVKHNNKERALAWGCNNAGQLALGTTTKTPQGRNWMDIFENNQLVDIVHVAAYDNHTIMLTSTGNVYVCGDNFYGQLCDGTRHKRLTLKQVNASCVIQIATCKMYTLMLTQTNKLNIRGNRINMQLVINDVTKIAAGGSHVLAITKSRELFTFGKNSCGQLGNGTTIDADQPLKIYDGTNYLYQGKYTLLNGKIVDIAAGESYSMALTEDGKLYIWGDNSYGQLGQGNTISSSMPISVMMGISIQQIAAGKHHAMALATDGTLYAWGRNIFGQVGDSTQEDCLSPVPIKSGITKIAAGGSHSLAISVDNKLYAWGYNKYGQLGDGTTDNHCAPIAIMN